MMATTTMATKNDGQKPW